MAFWRPRSRVSEPDRLPTESVVVRAEANGNDCKGLTDEELVQLAASGDDEAFIELYQRYKRTLFARVTKLLGPCAEREDVMQEILIQLHRSRSNFRGEAKFSTFLHRLASNVAIDQLRKRQRRIATVYDEQAIDEMAASLPDSVDRISARAQLELIFVLLDQIEPLRRMAFTLVTVEGLSHEEAAENLGVKSHEIKSMVRQVRAELHELMAREERRETRVAWRPA